jgi:hypothetical protein
LLLFFKKQILKKTREGVILTRERKKKWKRGRKNYIGLLKNEIFVSFISKTIVVEVDLSVVHNVWEIDR